VIDSCLEDLRQAREEPVDLPRREPPLAELGGDAYESRSEAQRAWRQGGRPSNADRNSDGKVCEGLSSSGGSRSGNSSGSSDGTAKTTDCERRGEPVAVTYSRAEYPNISDHISDAQRKGYPRVMRVNRVGTDERRDELLEGIPTRRDFQRDEYPPALGRTDSTARAASVRLVPSGENSSSGASLGAQLADYCDGTRFRFELTP